MGVLIGLEGIDASGKTTISLLLEEKLMSNGIKAKRVLKKNTDYMDKRIKDYTTTVKSLIWNDSNDPYHFVTSQGWLFKHALWYSVLAENYIEPNLKEYDVLIVDGWFYKIYSRFLLKEDFNKELLNSVFKSIRRCDYVFMLDASPEICWKRRENFRYTEMGGYDFEVKDPFKSFVDYQSKVREQLKGIGKKEDWNIIPTDNLTVNETVDLLFSAIQNLFVAVKSNEG